jgi:hypothetical protein
MGRLIRFGLVALALIMVATWMGRRVSRHTRGFSVAPAPAADMLLAPGDLRIYNRDSTVDLILRGNQVLAGLSPKTVAKIQTEMAKNSEKDSGFGGLIASTVKQTVANTIGTHVSYPIADIRDVRYDDGQLILERVNGSETRLFGDAKVNGEKKSDTFAREDAERFIEAVRARKRSLFGR